MITIYQIIQPTDFLDSKFKEVDWPEDPDYEYIESLMAQILDPDRNFDHIRVWHNDQYLDMFVDDSGMIDTLPVNPVATEIYHANILRQNPKADTSDWPKIHGPAILFHRQVWF